MVDRTVKLTKMVEIPPLSTIQVHGIMKVKGNDKRVNIVVKPKSNECNPSVVAIPSYTNLKPGSNKVNISLRNLISRSIMVKAESLVAKMVASNVISPMLVSKTPQGIEEKGDKKTKSPNMSFKGPTKLPMIKEQLKKLFDKLDLSGKKDCSKEDQKELQKLIKDFGILFILNDLDLGKTRVLTLTGKPGILRRHFPIREKSGKLVILPNFWKSQGNL